MISIADAIREEGIEKGILFVAEKLVQEQAPSAFIAKTIGLSMKKIEELQERHS